jgi:hypothetical protein
MHQPQLNKTTESSTLNYIHDKVQKDRHEMKQVAGYGVVAGDVDAVGVVGVVDAVADVVAAAVVVARPPPGLESNPDNSHTQSPIAETSNNHANTAGNVPHDYPESVQTANVCSHGYW